MRDASGLKLARNMRQRCAVLVFALAAVLSFIADKATAQPLAAAPPVFTSVDANGVDLVTGALNYSAVEVTIGQPSAGGLAYVRTWIGPGWRDNYVGTINSSGSTYTVSIGGASESFTLSGSTFTSDQAVGSTLTLSSGIYTYTMAGGAVALFDAALANGGASFDANVARITSLTSPNGEQTLFHYKSVTVQSVAALRLQSVTDNLGYQLQFEYSLNNPTQSSQLAAWRTLTKVTGINNAVDYCSPTADTCTGLSTTWPSATYATNGTDTETVTDPLGRVTRYTMALNGLYRIRRPSSSSADHVSMTYNAGRVANVTYGASPNFVSYNYSYSDNSGVRTLTVTNPNSTTRVVVSNLSTLQVTSDTDEVGRATSYQYDSSNRPTRVTQPEGNYTQYAYDARGNVTEVRQVAKSGTGLSDIVATANYDTSCSNQVTCNLPNSTTDPLGNTTNYTYDSTHGGVLSATLPDPDGGGSAPRPATRFSYSQLSAYYKDSSGSIVAAPSPVWRLTQTSACATSAWTGSACGAGAADETRTTIDYGSNGVANNRLPLALTTAAGDSSVSAQVTNTYDSVGNLLTVDGPLSGTADTTRYRFDAARQLGGIVGPDPDGGGSLKHRAMRFTYNADGQRTVAERGIVDSQSDADWTAFSSLQQFNTSYDFIGRPTLFTMTANSTTHFVTQMSYDSASRLECATGRMNPGQFSALPASACTLGIAAANGPDRITRFTYNAANQRSKVTTGYGTPSAIDDWTATFTNNGLMATLTDAGGNVTTYTYDGFDRLACIRFPGATGSGCSSSDDEEYAYNAASLVTQVTRRDGATLSMTYDNLLRATLVDASTNGQDISSSYDNFSRVLTRAFSGHTLTFAYDQLSRNLSQQSPLGTVSYQYDAAGRRTRITWPGSFCAQYAYDLTSAVTQISAEGGACTTTTLATYGYDNLGRRTSVTRGNSTSESVSFNDAGLISSLAQNLAGSGDDQTMTFDYNAAGQIVSRTGSDADYAWAPLAPATINYADNGLNQYTSVGGVTQTYDSRGNLTTGSFGYDIRNNLTSGPNSATLAYDPAGRLYETVGAATTRFLYDGAQIIAEYDGSGNVQRRFVTGPGLDELLAWYEGSGSSDRRWFIGDERGSVIAISNDSGAATNINRYDEYGIPDTTNVGRFQYTSQAWIGEVTRYHYRARTYAPTTGRFQQTDPISYAGGINLYAYVANDPMNVTDPFGLATSCWGSWPNIYCRWAEGTLALEHAGERALPANPNERGDGGDGGSGDDDATEDSRNQYCAASAIDLNNINLTIQGFNAQIRTVGLAAATTGAVSGSARAGRQADTAYNEGRLQRRLGISIESAQNAARGFGTWIGQLYVGAIYGPALNDFIAARNSLMADRQILEQRRREAACQ